MIYLLTPDQILYECLVIAKHQIAEVLHVLPSQVGAKITRKVEGALDFEFSVAPEFIKGVDEDDVKSVMRHVYWDVKDEMEKRIADARLTRGYVLGKLRGEATI